MFWRDKSHELKKVGGHLTSDVTQGPCGGEAEEAHRPIPGFRATAGHCLSEIQVAGGQARVSAAEPESAHTLEVAPTVTLLTPGLAAWGQWSICWV